MEKMLETMVKNLVEEKEEVTITQTEGSSEKEVSFEVKVAASDMGRVIGKQGRVAKAIRTVMKAIAGREHKKVVIEFVS